MTSKTQIDSGEEKNTSEVSYLTKTGVRLRKQAQKWDRSRIPYAIYGIDDGLNVAVSTIHFGFDLAQKSASDMHEFLVSPAGIFTAAAASISMMLISGIANYYKDDYSAYTLCNNIKDVTSNSLHIQIENDRLLYTTITPSGKLVQNHILLSELGYEPDAYPLQENELPTLLPHILKITAKRGHTSDTLILFGTIHLFSAIAILWPYFRGTIKGFKSTFKGTNNVLKVAYRLSGTATVNLTLSLGLGLSLGVICIINRIVYRYITDKRKDMMDNNRQVLLNILQHETLTKDHAKHIHNQAQFTSRKLNVIAFSSALLAGMIDSLYSYMGLLTVTTLCPPLLIAMLVLSCIYAVCCVALRLHEEYEYQRNLQITLANIELALYAKEHIVYIEDILKQINNPDDDIPPDLAKQLDVIITELMRQRKNLQSLVTHSYFSAMLGGIRSGLSAYTALSVTLFTITGIIALTTFVFMPAIAMGVVGAVISSGIIFIGLFIAYHLYQAYHFRAQQSEIPDDDLTACLKNAANSSDIFRNNINIALYIEPSPQFSIQIMERNEILRSAASAFGKGIRAEEFILADQEHDTPISFILAFIGASISTVIISLRAFIRGFGRPIFNPVILANPPSLKGEKVYQPGFFQTTATAVGSSPFPARVTEQVSPVERSASYR